MREGIKGIAFDLDGTLYPNHDLYFQLIPFAAKEMRLLSAFGKARNIIRGEYKESSGNQDDFYQYQAEITAKILSAPAQLLKEKIDNLIYRGWEPLFKKIKLFKGVPETLNALRGAGYKLGLLSDFPPETKLENLGVGGIWDAVLCSERCGALKPHPLSFTRLAEAMSLAPHDILYVGNSRRYDVAGAAGAGMKTAWIKASVFSVFPVISAKVPKADFAFSNYRQLYNYMIYL
ncbi:MAG: HAD family hydrolase [Treponema sp.]|nr:HAD family hydrolase [Treponema sp.]